MTVTGPAIMSQVRDHDTVMEPYTLSQPLDEPGDSN
jgi:hypothetical protein